MRDPVMARPVPTLAAAIAASGLLMATLASAFAQAQAPAPIAIPSPAQARAQARIDRPPDLVRDRPGSFDVAWQATTAKALWVLQWTATILGVVPARFDAVGSPQGEAADLFRLLAIAGYQVKEIQQEIGLSPKSVYSLEVVYELSGADLDYLDEQLELSEAVSPGLFGRLQRAIVTSVVAVNTGGGMRVSDIKVSLLPLPKAEFTIKPTEKAASGEDEDVYDRALKIVDRRVRELAATRLRR
ncbi:MAG: hypothetical protein IT561_18645 [Alphaproteobacteria bacterium]|nr:hypothetical protein [Alphaproteobacteria bacterium]